MNFITLPSGLRVNTAHILEYRQLADGKLLIVQSVFDSAALRFTNFVEDMTVEELDSLLRGPAVTPIVSFILNLDDLKPGKECQFSYGGAVKHGVIDEIRHSSSEAYLHVTSDGDKFTVWTRPLRVTCP
jgi:hypothetical protein